MAKLYWRVKISGKWQWTAATDQNTIIVAPSVDAIIMHHGIVENFKNSREIINEEE